MARIVYSGLINSIRGSIGGTTFQKNAYGYTIKNKPNMIKPNTFLQQKIKSYFLQSVQTWTTLSFSEQSDWNTWALTYPVYSKHNPLSALSGYSLFVKWNTLRQINGDSIVTIPSGPRYVLPPFAPTIDAHGEPADALRYSPNADPEESQIKVSLYVTRPVKDSKNFIGTVPKFMVSSGLTATQYPITTYFQALYGTLPVAGDLINLKMVMYNYDAAQLYPDYTAKITVGSFTP